MTGISREVVDLEYLCRSVKFEMTKHGSLNLLVSGASFFQHHSLQPFSRSKFMFASSIIPHFVDKLLEFLCQR